MPYAMLTSTPIESLVSAVEPGPAPGLPAPASAPERAPPGPPEAELMRTACAWLARGLQVWLATVVETYGAAPRPIGSMALLNELGQVAGSVSGGCVEDELTDWLRRDAQACRHGQLRVYGRDADERNRLRLPCNGQLRLWLEPLSPALALPLQQSMAGGRLVARELDLATGVWTLEPARRQERTTLQGERFRQVLGPTLRAVLIGAGDVSRCLAPIVLSLGFRVEVVDPREEYLSTWPHAGCRLRQEMPDDVLIAEPPDERTVVLALSHDPKLDDLALMEALRLPCLYVGAMGSARTSAHRKARLALFDVNDEQLDALHAPVGRHIGARTPPEIAVSIAADLVAVVRRPLPSTRELQ